VGLNLDENKIKFSVEIIKPSAGQNGQTTGKESGQHIILEQTADTLIEASRKLIRTSKRRLYYGHTSTWIIGERLASTEDFSLALDIVRRDQMLRLNSYLFITDKNPTDVFNTPTLYENLTATELVSVLEQTKYISEYSPINFYEFYKFLENHNRKSIEQNVTTITSTAVIKNSQMVGELNVREAAGLNWLLNKIKGGTITVILKQPKRASIEVTKAKTVVKPTLIGNQLKVEVYTNIKGTLADNMTKENLDKAFIKKVEKNISKEIEGIMNSTIKKLQELNTDITDIGLTLRREDPKEWHRVKNDWDAIFANADITIHANTKITHQGLVNEKPSYGTN